MKNYDHNAKNAIILKKELSSIISDLNLSLVQDKEYPNKLAFRIKGVNYIEECVSNYFLVVMYRNIKLLSSGEKLYGQDAYNAVDGTWINELNLIQHRTPSLTSVHINRKISQDWIIKFLEANEERIKRIRKKEDIKNKEMYARNQERELLRKTELEMEKLEINRLVQKNKDGENVKRVIAEKRSKGSYQLKTITCPRCNGDGGINGGCNKCDGKGYIEQI